jgi:hypothetical protein
MRKASAIDVAASFGPWIWIASFAAGIINSISSISWKLPVPFWSRGPDPPSAMIGTCSRVAWLTAETIFAIAGPAGARQTPGRPETRA